MNKKIQIMASVIMIIIILGIQVSYAISGSSTGRGFFTVNSEEIAQKDTLKITFDLNKIEYENFKIVLNSNINNNELYTNDNVTINEESNAVVINIDKTKLKLNKIDMCYVVPEDAQINSKIQLSAKVIAEVEEESQDDEGNVITTKQEKVVLQGSQSVTIIENKENENNESTKPDDAKPESEENISKKPDNKDNNEENNKENGNKSQDSKKQEQFPSANSNSKKTSTNINKSSFNMSLVSTSMMTGSSQIGTNIETVTYNGSNNNYLKKLKIKGISLNTKFNKENSNYFVKVTDTSSIKVTATAEDSSAKVVITGNDTIKKGTNKILIAVTAENGDTRYYRIFVNCTNN